MRLCQRLRPRLQRPRPRIRWLKCRRRGRLHWRARLLLVRVVWLELPKLGRPWLWLQLQRGLSLRVQRLPRQLGLGLPLALELLLVLHGLQ